MDTRFDRNIRLFGREGQERLRQTHVAVVGIGGIGTHVVQQLALLGVGKLTLVDHEVLADSNRNRYVGVSPQDVGTSKVTLGQRLCESIDPTIVTVAIRESLLSRSSFDAVARAGVVVGCVDDDGPRLVLNELCSAYRIPYIDVATDVVAESLAYGGRVFVNWQGAGCLSCMGVIDPSAVEAGLAGDDQHQDRRAIYGVGREHLDDVGPSVVTINGVLSSLAMTELMVPVVGLRESHRMLEYRGHNGIVMRSVDEPPGNCFFCETIRNDPDQADLERYLE